MVGAVTDAQRALLRHLAQQTSGSDYLYGGPRVRVAQWCERHGWLVLTDYGDMKGVDGRSDGERWHAKITTAGLTAVRLESIATTMKGAP
jgi:hypothetical protein